jgi:hypothetical protein
MVEALNTCFRLTTAPVRSGVAGGLLAQPQVNLSPLRKLGNTIGRANANREFVQLRR